MTHIHFRRVFWRLWKIERVTDPAGNPLRLKKDWYRREVFHSITKLGFGYFWYHPCVSDKQVYLI